MTHGTINSFHSLILPNPSIYLFPHRTLCAVMVPTRRGAQNASGEFSSAFSLEGTLVADHDWLINTPLRYDRSITVSEKNRTRRTLIKKETIPTKTKRKLAEGAGASMSVALR